MFRFDNLDNSLWCDIDLSLPDSTVRLARKVPYGFQLWKKRYGRRNLSENRNGSLEGMDLKCFPSCGLTRCCKEIVIADFLEYLRTLGRLLDQAAKLTCQAE